MHWSKCTKLYFLGSVCHKHFMELLHCLHSSIFWMFSFGHRCLSSFLLPPLWRSTLRPGDFPWSILKPSSGLLLVQNDWIPAGRGIQGHPDEIARPSSVGTFRGKAHVALLWEDACVSQIIVYPANKRQQMLACITQLSFSLLSEQHSEHKATVILQTLTSPLQWLH